jgi:DNA repair protein RecO (recombination protein O)
VASRTYRAEAIVLKTNDFAEADRILVLFTRHFGKVRVVAKGIRRATSRMAGHAEPLTHATYQLARGRELDVLTGAEARALYRDMRDDLALIAAGWYVAELVDRFTADRVPSAPLFDLLETALRSLDAGTSASVVCRWFDLHLLDRSGFRPELGVCAQCRRPLAEEANAWEPAVGGVICAACAGGFSGAGAPGVGAPGREATRGAEREAVAPRTALSVRALKSLRYLLVSDLETAARLRLDATLAHELDRHLRAFLRYVIDRDIATARLMDQLGDLKPARVS